VKRALFFLLAALVTFTLTTGCSRVTETPDSADGGAPVPSESDPCTACAMASCRAEILPCARPHPPCSPTSSAGIALALCLGNQCAVQCRAVGTEHNGGNQ
jgi:hypothetical protein